MSSQSDRFINGNKAGLASLSRLKSERFISEKKAGLPSLSRRKVSGSQVAIKRDWLR